MNDPVRIASGMVGTPYHHMGRLPGVGLDCIGLVMAVAQRMGRKTTDEVYPDFPQPGRLERWFNNNVSVFRRRAGPPEPGDVLTFWWSRRDLIWHVGIRSNVGLIHVSVALGCVCEMPLDQFWIKRVGPVYAWEA